MLVLEIIIILMNQNHYNQKAYYEVLYITKIEIFEVQLTCVRRKE